MERFRIFVPDAARPFRIGNVTSRDRSVLIHPTFTTRPASVHTYRRVGDRCRYAREAAFAIRTTAVHGGVPAVRPPGRAGSVRAAGRRLGVARRRGRVRHRDRRRRGPLPRPAVRLPPWHPATAPPRGPTGRPVHGGPGGAPAGPGPALVRWRPVAGGSPRSRPRSRFRSTSGARPPPARPPGLGRTPAMASIGRAGVPLTTLVPGSCPAFWKVDTNSTHPLFIPAPMV